METKELRIGGAVTWFRLAKSTSLPAVKAGLEGIGLGGFTPEPRSQQACLRAALGKVYEPSKKGRKLMVRPVKNGITGFAVVEEDPKAHYDAGDDYGRVLATAGFSKDGDLQVAPYDEEKLAAICAGMAGAAAWLPSGSVSKALIAIADSLHSVCLRDNGGVYWLNQDRMPVWELVSQVFEVASAKTEDGQDAEPTKVYVLPVVAGEQMVDAVGDALTAEIERDLATIEADLEDTDLTEAKCHTRLQRTAALETKVKRYEESFGRPLSRLAAQVNRTAAAVAMSSLALSASRNPQPLFATV